MKSILSQLFRGEYVGGAQPCGSDSELAEAFEKAERLEAEIKKLLTPEALAKFEEYISLCADRNFLVSEQDFISGFQLAVSLIAEGMEIKV